MGDGSKKAKLEIDGSFVNKGNVIVLGEGTEAAEFKIKKNANASIDGSFLIGTHDDAKKVKFESDGNLTVNGLFTMIGTKIEAKFKNHSDFNLTGMFQIATVDGNGVDKKGKPRKDEMKLEFKGDLSITKDYEKIKEGAEALQSLGLDHDIPAVEVFSYGWHQVNR